MKTWLIAEHLHNFITVYLCYLRIWPKLCNNLCIWHIWHTYPTMQHLRFLFSLFQWKLWILICPVMHKHLYLYSSASLNCFTSISMCHMSSCSFGCFLLLLTLRKLWPSGKISFKRDSWVYFFFFFFSRVK